MRCPNCNSESLPNAKFCAECGTRLDPSCPSCGAQNPSGAKFCIQCGTRLGDAAAPPASAPQSNPRPRPILTERAAADLQALPEGERKTITALFADIKGSMDLIEDLDPEQARAIIDPALKIMIDAVHRYDGYIVQSTGDGIFALFGAPIAHEDHPHRALLAGLKMQEDMRRYSARLREAGDAPIEVRIGVNTGDAVVRSIRTGELHTEYTPIGHSTSLAARMQVLAPTGSIAVTENVRRVVEGYFELKPLGPTRVKGLSEPINVYEVIGLGPLRTRLQASARRGFSKFVGRDAELGQMQHALQLARAGRGQIVAAVGDAGVGKSRLFYEFKIISREGCTILEAFSVSHGKASAYLPLIELLKNYFDINSDDDERKRREKIGGRVLMLDRALEDTLPYLFSLLGVSESSDTLAEMDPEIRKRRMLDAIKRLLMRESLNQPLIAVFEDLHWVDSETQVFLNLLADSIGTARVLMMVNYRPEYRHGWNNKSYYAQLRLDPLGSESAESLLGALLGNEPELAPLKGLIIERTEGNPFFMEETVQTMFEQGMLMRNGKVSLARPLSAIQIPASVKAILAARIDRLAPPQKDLVQTLSIIGKEFPLGLVTRVCGRAEDELAPMMSDLQLGEFIYEQPAFPDIEYVFKHALTQEVAYDSVLIERRKIIHEKIGEALEEMYGQQTGDHLPELAHHFSRSANLTKAIEYLHRAGELALAQSAYDEAIEKLTTAADLLDAVPPSLERDHQEVRVRSQLGQTLMAARGFSSPELQYQAQRLREMIGRTTDPSLLYHLLFSLWSVDFTRGNLKSSEELALRLLALVPGDSADLRAPSAYQVLGTSQLWLGRPHEARESMGRALTLFEPKLEEYARSPIAPVVPNRCQLGWALWFCGYPDQAIRRTDEAFALATSFGRPFSIAFALQYAIALYDMRRQFSEIRTRAETLIELARENGFPVWSSSAMTSLGRAIIIEDGDWEGGSTMMREGLQALRKTGGELIHSYLIVLFADACRSAGQVAEGLSALDLALEGVAKFDQRLLEPEIYRVRGELLLIEGSKEREAEDMFRTALKIAIAQREKSLELRAVMSLGRLIMKQGRPAEARGLIAPVYGFFTEGFETGDLKDAKELLAACSGS